MSQNSLAEHLYCQAEQTAVLALTTVSSNEQRLAAAGIVRRPCQPECLAADVVARLDGNQQTQEFTHREKVVIRTRRRLKSSGATL